jgi:hypothetical protein
VTDGFRTRDSWIHKGAPPTTHADFPEKNEDLADARGPSEPLPPRFAAASMTEPADPIEGALAEGVRALGEAMRRAPADQLGALAERMAVVVRELDARRTAREARAPARVVALDDRRRKR